ncbi:hypothetical protein CUMW_054830 [Citrus unshiu]|nr:hypothetical protein CUMW_054830 [Citrus unshiu]
MVPQWYHTIAGSSPQWSPEWDPMARSSYGITGRFFFIFTSLKLALMQPDKTT